MGRVLWDIMMIMITALSLTMSSLIILRQVVILLSAGTVQSLTEVIMIMIVPAVQSSHWSQWLPSNRKVNTVHKERAIIAIARASRFITIT